MGDITPFTPRTKLFCKRCGGKLEDAKAILDYDEYTGEARIVDYKTCRVCSRASVTATQQPWFPDPTRGTP